MVRQKRFTSNRARPKSAQQRKTVLQLELLEARWLPSGTASYGQLPLAFEPNVGQTSAGIGYLARGPGYSVGLNASGAFIALENSSSSTSNLIDVRLVGANSAPTAVSQDELPGVANYLIGNNPSDWHTNIPTYGQVTYQNVYPGVDLVYHGNQDQLEYDFVVNPGSSPGVIRLALSGVQALTLDAQGDLLVHTAAGVLTEKVPTIYQMIGGVEQTVAGRYVLENNGQVGFAVGAYDSSKPLVIDPVLQYSTYVGGSTIDSGQAITVDAAGDAYVTGYTESSNFPTAGSPVIGSPPPGGGENAFVFKLNADGSALLYSTYLGGAASTLPNCEGTGIAVDASGDAFVVGYTNESAFPTAGNPAQRSLRGPLNAFVTELNPTGSGLVYSTYLGGSGRDFGVGIAIDGSGDAYVTGGTNSTDFPTLNALQSTGSANGSGFVTKLNSTAQLVYSTYLGGSGGDVPAAVAVDSTGAVYVTGLTQSSNFPTVVPLQASLKGTENAFISKINPAGSALVYSTYLGGSATDNATAIAVNSAGDAYVGGDTQSSDFPTAGAPLQASIKGNQDGFVSEVNPTGSALVYSTFLGGANGSGGMPVTRLNGLTVDASGNAYVIGSTNCADFPTAGNAPQPGFLAFTNVFVSKLNPAGSALVYSTFLGNGGDSTGIGIALDSADNAYVTGITSNTNFQTNPGVVQGTNRGAAREGSNAFVSKLAPLTWQATGLTIGSSDVFPQLLWTGPGWADVWEYITALNNPHAGPALGPVSGGWSAVAEAVAANERTYILWANANTGQTALWEFASTGLLTGQLESVHVFAAMAGWTPIDMVVDSSNNLRILWTNAGGQAMVSEINSSFTETAGPALGPMAGFTAVDLAAGSDGLLRVLWNNPNGATSLWLLNADGSFNSDTVFGPIAGWTAESVAVGGDGNTRLLWSNTNGAAAIWDVTNAFAVTGVHIYGPYAGEVATSIVCGANGLEYVQWDSATGADVLWLLNPDDTFNQAAFYGPVVIS